MNEMERLRERITFLENEFAERETAEKKLRKLSRELTERVKELNCLYRISELRDKPGTSWNELLQGIVDLIPSAWQYPAITCARLVIHDREYKTDNFISTQWKLDCDIHVRGQEVGVIEVCYLKHKAANDHGPFLDEEKKLLNVIGERIEKIVERQQVDEQIQQQQEQLIQMDKMVALGTLVSGVAHEINNPNNFVMLNTPILADVWESILPILDEYYRENGDFLMGNLLFSEIRQNLSQLFSGILEGSKRIKFIVEHLKGFARVDTPEHNQVVDINSVVKSSLILINNIIAKSTKKFSVQYGKDLPTIRGNFQRLEQVIINLVQNACESLCDQYKGISIKTCLDQQQQNIVVEVRDEGVGIPPDKISRITDPFYTTKRDIGGTGLGLSISSGIVKNHGGKLTFHSVPRGGTTVILELPVSRKQVLNTNSTEEVTS